MSRALTVDLTLAPNDQDGFVAAHPDGTIFQTSAYLRTLREGYGHETIVLSARRGDALLGILPLVAMKQLFLGEKLVAMPYQFDTGEPLVLEPSARGALLERAAALARQRGVRHLEIRTTKAPPDAAAFGYQSLDSGLVVTDLRFAAFDPKKSISRGIRREVGYAAEAGLVIKRTAEPEALWRFRALWLAEMKAHGAPQAGKNFFTAQLRELAGALYLSEAWKGDRLIGGLLALGDRHAAYGRAVAGHTAEGRAHFVGKALTYDSILWAKERGVERYHMGITWTGDRGLKAYKDGWGGDTSPVSMLVLPVRGEAPSPGSYFGGFGLAKKVWSILPLWLADRLGHEVTRWIG